MKGGFWNRLMPMVFTFEWTPWWVSALIGAMVIVVAVSLLAVYTQISDIAHDGMHRTSRSSWRWLVVTSILAAISATVLVVLWRRQRHDYRLAVADYSFLDTFEQAMGMHLGSAGAVAQAPYPDEYAYMTALACYSIGLMLLGIGLVLGWRVFMDVRSIQQAMGLGFMAHKLYWVQPFALDVPKNASLALVLLTIAIMTPGIGPVFLERAFQMVLTWSV